MKLEDAGDLPLDESEADVERIRDAATNAVRDGTVPLFLGGDHMVTHPIVAGIAAERGPVAILHFDAHPDLYDDFDGDPLSHASPFARIMEREARVAASSRSASAPLTRIAGSRRRSSACETIEMRDFAPDRVPIPEAPLYISIDMDAFDPAFAPGVSHHEPGGLSVRDVLSVLHRIQTPIVGADIVEYNPARDVNGMTAVVAAKLVKEIAALAAGGNE